MNEVLRQEVLESDRASAVKRLVARVAGRRLRKAPAQSVPQPATTSRRAAAYDVNLSTDMRPDFTEDDLKIEPCPECRGAKLTIRTTRSADSIVTGEVPFAPCPWRATGPHTRFSRRRINASFRSARTADGTSRGQTGPAAK